MQALVINERGQAELQEIEPDLDGLKAIVGGWLEGITGDSWHAYCDEEGKLKGHPLNPTATALAYRLGWSMADVLCGPVVFLGNDPEGEEAPVPLDVIYAAQQLGLLEQSPVCESCQQPVTADQNGYWVGSDGSSDCSASERGHTVDGAISSG